MQASAMASRVAGFNAGAKKIRVRAAGLPAMPLRRTVVKAAASTVRDRDALTRGLRLSDRCPPRSSSAAAASLTPRATFPEPFSHLRLFRRTFFFIRTTMSNLV